MKPCLEIKDLSLAFGERKILNAVSLALFPGRITGLVGRSGSGKSLTAYAAMGLLPKSASVTGAVNFFGENLLALNDQSFSRLRGARVAMVFQEPMTSLNPLQTIESQIAESIQIHSDIDRKQALAQAQSLLERVGMARDVISPKRYPHELSGGQRQRVVIAMAIAMKPQVLFADEPTTALDVTTQSEILSLLRNLAREDGIALLFITHDLAAVADMADDLAVMENGQVIESGSIEDMRKRSEGAFRDFLIMRDSKASDFRNLPYGNHVLQVENLSCSYAKQTRVLGQRKDRIRAVNRVSFQIKPGECLGVVGESGSGKSTLARAILGLQPVDEGLVRINGEEVDFTNRSSLNRLRRAAQIVFQDPYSSFNPRHNIEQIVSEPLHLFPDQPSREARRLKVAKMLKSVGLETEHIDRYPHAFSGGQRQRIAVARALMIDPDLIVLDEATSALDIASQNHLLSLLKKLRQERGVAMLFISHDLNVIREIADCVAVMKNGKIVEYGAADAILNTPQHDYTQQLVAAASELQRALDNFKITAA